MQEEVGVTGTAPDTCQVRILGDLPGLWKACEVPEKYSLLEVQWCTMASREQLQKMHEEAGITSGGCLEGSSVLPCTMSDDSVDKYLVICTGLQHRSSVRGPSRWPVESRGDLRLTAKSL